MAHIERSISIDAPVEAVFDHFHNINRWVQWWPRLRHARGHQYDQIQKDSTFDWSHEILGIPIGGGGKITEVVPNERLRMESKGGIESRWDVSFAREGEGRTKLSVAVDYTLPGGTAGAVADTVLVEKLNDKELKHGLENLKELCEHRKGNK